jgi:hypothetical protein
VPFFELEWLRLKTEHRQNSLPKVRIAISRLPKRFFVFLEKGRPRMHVKSVLAAVFLGQRGTVI